MRGLLSQPGVLDCIRSSTSSKEPDVVVAHGLLQPEKGTDGTTAPSAAATSSAVFMLPLVKAADDKAVAEAAKEQIEVVTPRGSGAAAWLDEAGLCLIR